MQNELYLIYVDASISIVSRNISISFTLSSPNILNIYEHYYQAVSNNFSYAWGKVSYLYIYLKRKEKKFGFDN